MFRKRKKVPEERKTYDIHNEKPVLRCSICTGEQVAGFQDKKTGEFREIMLVRNEKELEEFKREYGITDIEKIY